MHMPWMGMLPVMVRGVNSRCLKRAQPPSLCPPMCSVKETAGEQLLIWSGLTAIALQLAGAYVALSLALRLPSSSKNL